MGELAVIYVIDGGAMDQNSGQESRPKCMGSRHSLEIELMRFVNGIYVQIEF